MQKLSVRDQRDRAEGTATDTASGLTDEENLDIIRDVHEVDACELCHGAKGGVLGNENIIMVGGAVTIACDYCSVAQQKLEDSMGL
jgi:hypothetical protein